MFNCDPDVWNYSTEQNLLIRYNIIRSPKRKRLRIRSCFAWALSLYNNKTAHSETKVFHFAAIWLFVEKSTKKLLLFCIHGENLLIRKIEITTKCWNNTQKLFFFPKSCQTLYNLVNNLLLFMLVHYPSCLYLQIAVPQAMSAVL